eukprot:276370-Prymnesium_polylepis.2
MTTGMRLRVASSSSTRHHGRVSTPCVARSTTASLLCKPSVISCRKSLREEESENKKATKSCSTGG